MLIHSAASLIMAFGLASAPPPDKPLTLDQAVHKVQDQTGGRILSADRMRSGHGSKYRIKTLMKNGRVRVIEVDSNPDKKMRNLPDKKYTKEKR
ncbi:MAG: hypothetical protein WCD66_04920 [Rhodanobacteraceae bacterium]